MTKELSEVAVGFDLDHDYSQMTFYNQNTKEPITVMTDAEGEKIRFATPRDLFSLIEQQAELGIALLSNFFKEFFDKLPQTGRKRSIAVMVTMEQLRPVWARAIVQALEMLEISRDRIFLQDHQESFYYYALNQKKDLWRYKVALFEYEKEWIRAYELQISYKTRPAMIQIEKRPRLYLDKKARGDLDAEGWRLEKDQLLLEQAKEMMGGEAFSAIYLIGEQFGKEWMDKSLAFLCRKCHVYQGNNLYTIGACYGAMHHAGIAPLGDYLYDSPDMVKHNIGMEMQVRDKLTYHNMITAGINYCVAEYECEFLLDNTHEVELLSRSLQGASLSHTIEITGLPKRPNKGTRLRMKIDFTAPEKCRVKLDDLGLGALCPSSGKKWDAVIEL